MGACVGNCKDKAVPTLRNLHEIPCPLHLCFDLAPLKAGDSPFQEFPALIFSAPGDMEAPHSHQKLWHHPIATCVLIRVCRL